MEIIAKKKPTFRVGLLHALEASKPGSVFRRSSI